MIDSPSDPSLLRKVLWVEWFLIFNVCLVFFYCNAELSLRRCFFFFFLLFDNYITEDNKLEWSGDELLPRLSISAKIDNFNFRK